MINLTVGNKEDILLIAKDFSMSRLIEKIKV